MLEEIIQGRLSQYDLEGIGFDYARVSCLLDNYKGTNIKHANAILTQLLTSEEKKCLDELLFGEDGWYRRINGDGMTRLQLAAMSLNFSTNVFSIDPQKESFLFKKSLQYTEKEQNLVMCCYMKQKAVTYVTLKNYLIDTRASDIKHIKVYRGINVPFDGQAVMMKNLESWTANINIAYKFARNEGFVVERNVELTDVFLSRRTVYKHDTRIKRMSRGFLSRREHEIIVENRIVELTGKQCNFYDAKDKEIY